jgi:enoyl-CoA hydratase/carnithine racemase
MTDMMLTGRVLDAQEAHLIGVSNYLVPEGKSVDKAVELAKRVAQNAPLTNFALMHALPRIADQSMDEGLLTEAMMAAIAQSAPEAKARLRDFLDNKANKVKRPS